MIRICFVVTIYGTYRAFLKNFSQYLHSTGEYDISLICDPSGEAASDVPEYVHFYPVHMSRGIYLINSVEAVKHISRILKEQRFDIVQYSTPNAAFYTSLAAYRCRIPVRLYCQWGIRYMGFGGFRRLIFKAVEKVICRLSTKIEAESHNIKNFAIQEGLYPDSKCCVVWNGSASGVDLTKFDVSKKTEWRAEKRELFAITDDTLLIVFCARITGDKGINELLGAFFDIRKQKDNIKLAIVGGVDDLTPDVDKERMERARQSADVFMPGAVDDVEKYFAAADIFVSPSYREGFGLVVIEASAMGLPVIVTDVPGQIDAVIPEGTGITCKVRDTVDLEKAMTRMIDDRELQEKLGTGGIDFVKEKYEQKELFRRLKLQRDDYAKSISNNARI